MAGVGAGFTLSQWCGCEPPCTAGGHPQSPCHPEGARATQGVAYPGRGAPATRRRWKAAGPTHRRPRPLRPLRPPRPHTRPLAPAPRMPRASTPRAPTPRTSPTPRAPTPRRRARRRRLRLSGQRRLGRGPCRAPQEGNRLCPLEGLARDGVYQHGCAIESTGDLDPSLVQVLDVLHGARDALRVYERQALPKPGALPRA